MERGSSRVHASVFSGTVGLVLAGIFFFLWMRFGVPEEYLRWTLFGTVLFSIALITVTVYQSFKIYERANVMAKDMTKDMLMYSHELFSELYRSSPVPYLLIDGHGRIESINFSAARLFHVEVDALDGINVFDFIDTESSPKAPLISEYFKQGKFVNDVEVMVKRPDQATRWVMLSLFSFRDAKNHRKGLLTLVDITKQKQIDMAKTEFVSLASHQLRTPISSMKWNIELLETAGKDTFGTTERSYIEKISHGLERMDTLVGDFLSVSKFELGTLVPERTPLDLQKFLTDINEEHRGVAESKQVKIKNEWNGTELPFITDSHLLHMIVSNLVSNAVKYTPGGGTVTIHAEHTASDLTVTITDTGIGIPEEDQDMIFSKLFRATNARSLVVDGTGLGLYIVREAARVLGGTVTFESKPGIGTTFTVRLPK